MRLKTVLKQRFHGPKYAGIGLDSQDRGRITLFNALRQGWERARPGFAVRGADQGHTGHVCEEYRDTLNPAHRALLALINMEEDRYWNVT